MNRIDLNYTFKGKDCVKMQSGKYTAIIAPSVGSSVLRFRDDENDLEIFKFRKFIPMKTIEEQREIWGLPTLYLPNRFDKGVLRTSDSVYELPINEPLLDNFIHGWVHKREHEIECYTEENGKCVLITSYVFDEKDEMYKYFPLDFKISYTFTLSPDGLKQEIYLTSNAEKALPVSICTHTCINAPLKDGGDEADLRLCVPIGERCELNRRCLPTEKLLPLADWDKEYKDGQKVPVGQPLDNDMYTAVMNEYNGKPFNGVIVRDLKSGHTLLNEVSKEFRFWNMWNDSGDKGYFCPEPMTAMINSANLSLGADVTGYCELKKGETYKCWQRFYTE
ncbi:aldose 1-epimerase [Ruminococcus albus]|uniref:Aldose 1-epimerase n=1 Tax=Ruminococcus albus (strain ATCC 27210 / DSM 20455 / JCM 14654 / NCDO 2250 / 7) TaxID=697329 RepID=E6UCF0_RUMA7|nr:aldose 1-epimerase [Ruminococcus albus]ADU20742.1 Aldose 1-epimerase [Ruminococcus albus 7 = DSM 20455]